MGDSVKDTRHRVVIIGGGFGGLYAAKHLRNAPVQVTVVDRRNFHLFQPLLYQVATGGLSPGDIAAPIRTALRNQRNSDVLLGTATDLDVNRKLLFLDEGRELPYDSLVVATGATHSYFGHPEWERTAPGLKTLEDATEIRRRILYAFEVAERETSPDIRREWLTFVIVGGGPTGVELAGAIGEVANQTLRDEFRHINTGEARIILLDAGSRILSTYPEELSREAEAALVRLSVRTRTGMRVTSIDAGGVTYLNNGVEERIPARSVFWAAGVQASGFGKVLFEKAGAKLDRAGRVQVQPDLTIPGHPDIFVIGDLAAVTSDGKPVPGVAPAAMQMGSFVAAHVAKRASGEASDATFRYFDKGSLAVIGRASAVADFGTVRLSGLIAWLAWLFIHLMYIVGFQNRVLVFTQWAFHYFTFSRGARLIVGTGQAP